MMSPGSSIPQPSRPARIVAVVAGAGIIGSIVVSTISVVVVAAVHVSVAINRCGVLIFIQNPARVIDQAGVPIPGIGCFDRTHCRDKILAGLLLDALHDGGLT